MLIFALDDEPLLLRKLKRTIAEVLPDCEIRDFTRASVALNVMETENIFPDIVFLDIEMPYLTGLDLLASLSNPPRVIITSAYEQYALKGYEFDITDYLLKPISFDRFLKAVNKVHHLMLQLESSEPTDFIFVRSDRQMYKVFFKDILFVEGLENYVQIYTETHKLLTRTTMKRISEMLPDGNFLQVHKSYIINTKKIDLIDGNSILIGTHSITVARNYRNEVFTRILKNTL